LETNVKTTTKEQIIATIRMAEKELERIPTRPEFTKRSGLNNKKLLALFPGGFREALRAAGFTPRHNGMRVETAELMADWGRVARKLGKAPTREEYEVHGKHSYYTMLHRVRRWIEVRKHFLEFAQNGGGPEWDDVVAMVRETPVPYQALWRRWKENGGSPGASPLEVVQDGKSFPYDLSYKKEEPQLTLERPAVLTAENAPLPLLVGRRCVTAQVLAVFMAAGKAVRGELRQNWLGAQETTTTWIKRRVLRDRPLMGAECLIPGMAHEPVNEQGVLFLFGMLAQRLGFMVQSLQSKFPDCLAKMEVEPGLWQDRKIEFEFRSSHFRAHGHDPSKADMIVCWVHDWEACPEEIEVIALREVVRRLGWG
jgi:hypothetical protein